MNANIIFLIFFFFSLSSFVIVRFPCRCRWDYYCRFPLFFSFSPFLPPLTDYSLFTFVTFVTFAPTTTSCHKTCGLLYQIMFNKHCTLHQSHIRQSPFWGWEPSQRRGGIFPNQFFFPTSTFSITSLLLFFLFFFSFETIIKNTRSHQQGISTPPTTIPHEEMADG